ncbi:hypothetical protein EVAR_12301_1 [Eumeta japonica]|uniref:Osiris 8 n=1 Tax=Eumeta variegata TaxID=151549 RepID=A0A4C1TU96_EUMVA|nr:hypothetical protein EVAR_12301_1 [Eumeta japonica]
MARNYLILLALIATTSARIANQQNSIEDEPRSTEDSILADLKVAYETYKECSGGVLANCLKVKLAKALTRLSASDEINLTTGITMIRDKDAPNDAVRVDESVPRGLGEGALDNLILDKIFGFLQTHTVQIKFPAGSELERAFGEGRDKRKKMAPLLAIPLLIGGMMVPLAFGALALLAGKALIVSKLALVLAGIIGLKKLLSPSGGGHEAHEVVVSAGHGGSGWSRSMEKAHDLAYNAYAH